MVALRSTELNLYATVIAESIPPMNLIDDPAEQFFIEQLVIFCCVAFAHGMNLSEVL